MPSNLVNARDGFWKSSHKFWRERDSWTYSVNLEIFLVSMGNTGFSNLYATFI